jgi:hypothetical protein
VFVEHLHGAFSEAVTIASGMMEACPLIMHISNELQKLGPDVALQQQSFFQNHPALWRQIMELLGQLSGVACFVGNCKWLDARDAPLPAEEPMENP